MHFFKKEIKYLGNIINEKGIRADVERLKKFSKEKLPTTKRGLQSLLGYLNWFRPYVKNISRAVAFMNDKINKKVEWNNEEILKVKKIYEEINKNIMLSYPNYKQNFELEIDACEIAMGAVLYQKENILGIYSKKFNNSEKNYSNPEKEFYAIYSAVNHFRDIIYGRTITIKTDHANTLSNTYDLYKRIEKWKISLMDFDIQYKFIRGKENVCADYLSRCFITRNEIRINIYPWKDIVEAQKRFESKVGEDIIVIDKYKIILDSNGKIKVPYEDSEKIIKEIHENIHHPGVSRLYESVKKFLACKSLKTTIANVIRKCKICQVYKNTKTAYGKLKGYIESEFYNDAVSSDIFGPIDSEQFEHESDAEKIYFLTITNIFSRYTRIFILYTIKSSEIIKQFEKYFKEESIPTRIITDEGTQYTGKMFKKLLDNNKIKHVLLAKDNPQGNGISESINKNIAFQLRYNKGNHIESIKDKIENSLNMTYHTTLKFSPHEIKYKYSVFDPKMENQEITEKEILENLRNKSIDNNKYMNKNRINYYFKIGDLCLIKNRERKSKLCAYYIGPFKIEKISNNCVYVKRENLLAKESIRNIRPFFV